MDTTYKDTVGSDYLLNKSIKTYMVINAKDHVNPITGELDAEALASACAKELHNTSTMDDIHIELAVEVGEELGFEIIH